MVTNTYKYRWLNKKTRKYLKNGYLTEGQTAEERIQIICDTAEKILKKEGFAHKLHTYIANGWIGLSSPIWSNFGNKRGYPISCFSSYFDDTIVELLTKTAETGVMTKVGGGTSGYFGAIRPRGSPISTGGTTNGAVHFMQLVETTTNVISQSNVRRGSFAAYLPIDHPDFEEFLNIKEVGNPLQQIHMAACVSDEFMNEMLNGNMRNRELWAKMVQKRCGSGEPYLFFSDNVNRQAPQVYKDKGIKINNSNLCVSGNQRVVSQFGLLTAKELYEINKPLQLFDNKSIVSASSMKLIKQNADTFKITLTNGLTHTITDDHQLVVRAKRQFGGKYTTIIKKCSDLNINDKVAVQTQKGIFGTLHLPNEAFLLGLYQADGTQHKDDIHICVWENDFDLIPEIQTKFDTIYEKYEENLINKVKKPVFRESNTGFSTVRKKSLISKCLKKSLNFEKGYIPEWIWTADEKTQWQYVRGLYYADGTCNITKSKGNPFYLSITNINKPFLEELQILLANLGISAALSLSYDEREVLLPDGKGGERYYSCKKSYRLVTGNKNDGILFEINTGFLTRKGINLPKPSYRNNGKKFHNIKSIEYVGKEDVYCCTVNTPEHLWICNGFITHNCNEIMLSSSPDESFVCDLSSVNLLYWDEWKDTDLIETVVYLLDAVMTEFIEKTENEPFMQDARRFAINQRALGVGVIGYHTLLQSKMIPFESFEAKMLNATIFKTMREQCDAATILLAKEYGEPPLLEGYGRRNSTTMALAPTTSNAHILGQVSQAIEPYNSNYYTKGLAKGDETFKNPYLKEVLDKHGKDEDEIWENILVHGGSVQQLPFLSDLEKDVFKTFGEISQKEIVIQAAQRQRYIDQGQSLNLMIPADADEKEISDLLIFGWDMGLKGFYYQRSTNSAQSLSRSIMTCKSCES